MNLIAAGERQTAGTTADLTIAANYGGRWDIVEGRRLGRPIQERCGKGLDRSLAGDLSMAFAPNRICSSRTGGEQSASAISCSGNWPTELYFTDELWPEFRRRWMPGDRPTGGARRFGRTSEQL